MTDSQLTPPGNEQQNSAVRAVIRQTRRMIIAVIGGTVVLFGIALLVLPGPGLAVIALGIAILAIEFAWAKRALERGKLAVTNVKRRFGTNSKKTNAPSTDVKDHNEETT